MELPVQNFTIKVQDIVLVWIFAKQTLTLLPFHLKQTVSKRPNDNPGFNAADRRKKSETRYQHFLYLEIQIITFYQPSIYFQK